MDVKQIYNLVNAATGEVLGQTDLVAEDLTNLVDIGTQIFNADAVDRYVRALVNRIGKTIFVNRKYNGTAPSVYMDEWEFGSVVEKITMDLPEATENESWELVNGETYSQEIFYKPQISAKFFNSLTTFEVDISITERQVKQSFSNDGELNAFVSMIYNAIEKTITVKTDALIMRTINNFIGETLYDAYPDTSTEDYDDASYIRAVNLLYLYNQTVTTPITAADALYNPDFIRFAALTMGLYEKRLAKISTLFNIGGKDRFTPADKLHTVLHADFMAAAAVYLYSDTYHNNFVSLPNAESVPYWQGSGDGYDFADTSAINIKTASGNDVDAGGIIGVMFDRDALGVTNKNRRVTKAYNAKAEFINSYYKVDAGYFNDTNENFVVFFIA